MFNCKCTSPVSDSDKTNGKGSLRHCVFFAAALLLLVLDQAGLAQRTAPTAVRRASIQAGAGFSLASPDYSQAPFLGGSAYATYDFSQHLGVEFMFHQVNTRGDNNIYERTYELGPRYVLRYGAFEPFIRVAYGRGVFNYPDNVANLAYNMVTAAGGADIRLTRHVYARGEFEVQRWVDFPPNGLQPTVVTLGAAYRF